MGMSRKQLEERRMRAAELFAGGTSQAEVARQLGVSAQSAHRWHKAWESGGKAALKSQGKPGPEPRLDQEDLKRLQQVLLDGPEQFGFRTNLWTLERITEVVRKIFGVKYHPAHMWKILQRMGWSPQKPTTSARERDDEAVQRWLEEEWPRIKKGPAEREQR